MSHPTNIEAGNIPYPTDIREIALTERSVEVLWRAFPYLQRRYGQRGRRFGSSDVGYLVVCAGLPSTAFLDQVIWLGGILASRGMPSWLLECQLRHLAACGRRRHWAGANRAAEGAETLADRRRAVLSEAQFRAAGRTFRDARPDLPPRLAEGTGRLLASAVADTLSGLAPSAEPFLGWLTAHFDDGRATQRTLAGLPSLPEVERC